MALLKLRTCRNDWPTLMLSYYLYDANRSYFNK